MENAFVSTWRTSTRLRPASSKLRSSKPRALGEAAAPLDSGCSDEKAFSPTSPKLRPAKVQNKIAAADVASQLRAREPLCRGKGLVDSAESFDACVAEEFPEIGASGSVYGRDDAGR